MTFPDNTPQTPEEYAARVAQTVAYQQSTGLRAWTTDLLTGHPYSFQLPMAVSSYSYGILNGVGECTGVISLDAAEDPVPALPPRKACLWLEDAGRLVWGGILWDTEPDLASRTLSVTAQTWSSYLTRRLIRDTLTYPGTDQLAVYRALWAYAASKPGGDIDVTIDQHTTGVPVTISWGPGAGEGARPDKPISEAIADIAGGEPGCEWMDDWYSDGGVPRKRIRLGKPLLGGPTGLLFTHPGNVLSHTWVIPGKDSPNSLVAVGAGEGTAQLTATAVNSAELDAGYPLLEATSSGDYKEITNPDVLASHAAADLAALTGGAIAPEFTLRVDVDPRPGSYTGGDQARVMLTNAYHRARPGGGAGWDGTLRITGVRVTPATPEQAGAAVVTTMGVA